MKATNNGQNSVSRPASGNSLAVRRGSHIHHRLSTIIPKLAVACFCRPGCRRYHSRHRRLARQSSEAHPYAMPDAPEQALCAHPGGDDRRHPHVDKESRSVPLHHTERLAGAGKLPSSATDRNGEHPLSLFGCLLSIARLTLPRIDCVLPLSLRRSSRGGPQLSLLTVVLGRHTP